MILVKQPKVGRIKTFRALVIRGTTIKGDKRARFVKEGEIVEVDEVTFWTLKGQAQVIEAPPEPPKPAAPSEEVDEDEAEDPKKPRRPRPGSKAEDSAGNPIVTR